MRITKVLAIFFFLFSAYFVFAGTTGKIAGRVFDEDTGDPLPGANIIVVGTTMGAMGDMNGEYFIINIPPGKYTVKVTMMGYKAMVVENVRVSIDITTSQDFALPATIVDIGEEVTIIADRPVIQPDVAASLRNISSSQIEALPVTTVTEVIGLQAGITSALGIRGGSSDEALFMVDGIALRDERNNQPITKIPLSAVKEISVQTGGFNAEYHNVRSGVVNIVAKEGDPKYYSGTITIKYGPPASKHFGISPYDPNSFWLRPYLDPDVSWTGTSGETYDDLNSNGDWDEEEPFVDYNGDGEWTGWDKYTQRQYPPFDGWNAVSNRTLQDDDPTNDLTPEAAQRIYLWEKRKEGHITKPDYNVDLGFGGPVPVISERLGNLRFYTSFRKEQNMYLIPLSRDALTDRSWMTKLTSDITPSMKLTVLGLYGETYAAAFSRSGGTSYMEDTWDVASTIDRAGHTITWRLFTNDYWCPTSRYYNAVSAKLTHVLNPSTFYEVLLKRVGKKYHTLPGRHRDRTKKYEIFEGYFVDEAPFGFDEDPVWGIDGMGMGGSVSTSRDTSEIITTTAKFDFVSQINHNNQIKTGLEFVYDDFDMKFGMVNLVLPEGNTWTSIERKPYRGSIYLQDKIEYKGFISTIGLNMEYSNPNGNWYVVDIYDRGLYSSDYKSEDEPNINMKKAKSTITLSPRLAVSHPITQNSKLYFNYGHFRQMPTSERLYRVQRDVTNKIDYIGDPTLPLAKTVAYELGYDQALFNIYLLHLAAYYKDISDQEDWTRYISWDGKVNYRTLTSNSYEDIRGFEIDLTKMRGRWMTGNVNYEYRVGTSGYFGLKEYNENPVDQRNYLRQNPYQEKPLPRPRIKSNIDFHTPPDFGPKLAGQRPLGGWHLNFIARWTAGSWFTWNPNNIAGIEYNVQWKDYHNVDLKMSKTFPYGNVKLTFFMDVNNLFNVKDFSGESFYDSHDYDYYMESLHLPASIGDELGYGNIPGDDRPGDGRKTGVDYVPVEWKPSISNVTNPNSRVIYYDASTEKYMQYVGDVWVEVESKRIDEILDNKAYIDMPNQTYFTFLNPRDFFFGINVTFDLKF
ncbi:TonB-dependent receptor [candidate division KSB1 bacterium]|nr:TonB-dependent receptor [candidate division KSB1 bacterium]